MQLALERILAHQATPKPGWQQLDESSQDALARLASSEPIGSRHSKEYQHLLDGFTTNQGYADDETGQVHSSELPLYMAAQELEACLSQNNQPPDCAKSTADQATANQPQSRQWLNS